MRILICAQVLDKNHPILGFFHAWVVTFAEKSEVVHVICLQKGECNLPENVHVYSLGKEDGENRIKYVWRFYKYFWKIYTTENLTHVFYHMGAIYNILGAPFFMMRKWKKVNFLWWKTHGHINVMGRIALRFVDSVLSASKESFPVKTGKLRVVGHAVDTHLFTCFERGVVSTSVRILFVGRIMPVKRIEDVLAVVSTLKKQGVNATARLVGVVADDDYMQTLQTRCAELGIQDRVTFVGALKHEALVSEYCEADVLLNPSDTDSIDKVVLEAMTSGVIPVTSTVAFGPMLSEYGLYVAKGDIGAYVDTIHRIVDMDGDTQKVMRDSLRSLVSEHHALETITNRIFNHD